MKKALAPLSLGLALAGCVSPGPRPPGTALPPPRPTYTAAGLERVLGRTAAEVQALLGTPDADVREGDARKLQFSSDICVLDTYLYPKGSAAPVVTYVDARQPDGRPIDRASCLAALVRRSGGR